MAFGPEKPDLNFLPAPIPKNESERVAALRAFDILDSAEEDIYNSITKAAADVCQTSMASLTFIDEHRQWFKSRIGLPSRETSREPSFCAHAINGSELFLVQDTWEDARFKNNPFVIDSPYLRFYAGMPLLTQSGLAVGTLCVLDTQPRSLNQSQTNSLITLASSAMRVLQLRRNMGVTVFAKAVDMASDGVTISDGSTGELSIIYSNPSFLQMTGFEYFETVNKPPIFTIDSECQPALSAFSDAVQNAEMRTTECRFQKKDGEVRWARVSFVPYIDDNHKLIYLVSVYRDITEMKEAELQIQQLHAMRTTVASLAHVVKNFLNSAQLYSAQVNREAPVERTLQAAFDEALTKTRTRLAAIERMDAFKDRPTPFGFSMLDVEEK